MSDEQKQELSLSAEEQSVFDHDLRDLTAAEEQYDLHGKLTGRLKYGLDPASMMVIRDLAPLARQIIAACGTTEERVWPYIARLHQHGPWAEAERLSAGEDPEVKVYLILIAATHESTERSGYTPREYLDDRKRVMETLRTFTLDQFKTRKEEVEERVTGFEDRSVEMHGKQIRVAVATNDAALALAVRGFKGCVIRDGEMTFAQTEDIPDQLLEERGFVRGFGERFNPSLSAFERVSPDTKGARVVWVAQADADKPMADMTPMAKRIAPGYLLTYGREDLALDLVQRSILEADGIKRAERERTTRPERLRRLEKYVEELFPGEEHASLRERIRASFNVPQWGAYHNEGMLMDTHLDLMVTAVEALCAGGKEAEALLTDLEPTLAARVRAAVAQDREQALRYVFLHDLDKRNTLGVFKKTDRAPAEPRPRKWRRPEDAPPARLTVDVAWEQWEELVRDPEDPVAVRAYLRSLGVDGISYIGHGGMGADHALQEGIEEHLANGIRFHELGYQPHVLMASIREQGEVKSEDVDFILAVNFLDQHSSYGEDGRGDVEAMKNIERVLHNIDIVRAVTTLAAAADKRRTDLKIVEQLMRGLEKRGDQGERLGTADEEWASIVHQSRLDIAPTNAIIERLQAQADARGYIISEEMLSAIRAAIDDPARTQSTERVANKAIATRAKNQEDLLAIRDLFQKAIADLG